MKISIPVAVALSAAVGVAVVGVVFGTYAAGGSDSSCYSLMAEAFASGSLQPSSVLAATAPWPDALATFTPGGFVPSPNNRTGFAPVCAPGFSLLLAPFFKIGGPVAMFCVTPLAGALLVWLTFLAGRSLNSAFAGAIGAVLVATSPPVLYQVVQPMNDIMTAMLWMAVFTALVRHRYGAAGVCCGLALLVRPNLLPLAALTTTYVVAVDPKKLPSFIAGAFPFGLLVLWLNSKLYGGPFVTGYGQPGRLFSASYFGPNAARYLGWLVETHTPLFFAALAAPLVVPRERRPPMWLGLGIALITFVIYSIYNPFTDWSYLRFLLPSIALLSVLTGVTIATLAGKADPKSFLRTAAAVLVVVAVAGFQVRVAKQRFAFSMHTFEQRYRSAGQVIRDTLPPGAVLLSVWDSGAVRFHGREEALVWEALDPSWLDRSLRWLESTGHKPYILIESWEEPRFRQRFAASSAPGQLDWPPKYEVDRVVRIYDPADRERYFHGENVITQYVWPFKK